MVELECIIEAGYYVKIKNPKKRPNSLKMNQGARDPFMYFLLQKESFFTWWEAIKGAAFDLALPRGDLDLKVDLNHVVDLDLKAFFLYIEV